MLKRCPRCAERKPLADFYPRSRGGTQDTCKPCDNARSRAWRASRPTYEAERAARDPGRHRRYSAANRGKKRAYGQAWARKNAAHVAAYEAARRAAKLRATPEWLAPEDHELTRFLYQEAAALEKHTGVEFHVDHIVPLRGATVCGLHVPWNLRVISADRNRRKYNKLAAD